MGKHIKVVATGTDAYSSTLTSAATSMITDPNWITIGTQTWAKYNLNIGSRIDGSQVQTNNSTIEKYCYGDVEANCTNNSGSFYQWNEAMSYSNTESAQGICPMYSHIPSDNEWKILEIQLGMTQEQSDGTSFRGTNQGTQLKSGGSSEMNLSLAGYRGATGLFYGLSSGVSFWSSSESGANAWYRYLDATQAGVNRIASDKQYGFSVRCLVN